MSEVQSVIRNVKAGGDSDVRAGGRVCPCVVALQ